MPMEHELLEKVIFATLEKGQTPARIRAFAEVIMALKGTTPSPKPNEVKEQVNDEDLTEDKQINFSEITGFQVDGGPVQKTQVYA